MSYFVLIRVLMHFTYTGNFNDIHKNTKKRRMIGPAKENAISSIFTEGLSCETYREREAVRLMEIGISLHINTKNSFFQKVI